MRFQERVYLEGHLPWREGVRRHSWEEGVGVVWVGKRNNGYHNMGDMLKCKRFSALKGAVLWSRCTMGGIYCEMALGW